jgi:hypothetical protein
VSSLSLSFQVTCDDFYQSPVSLLQQYQSAILSAIRACRSTSMPPSASNEQINSQPTTAIDTAHTWDGVLHLVPKDFDFPRRRYGRCGSDTLRQYPLRELTPHDMPSKKLRNSFSDLRFLMKRIEVAAAGLGIAVRSSCF